MPCYAKYLIIIISFFNLVAQDLIIPGVPDYSQPLLQTLPSTTNITNFCSPFAALNIVEYWEFQVQHAYAIGMTAGLPAKESAEYIAWFMETNDNGSPQRLNGSFGSVNGTYTIDQLEGFRRENFLPLPGAAVHDHAYEGQIVLHRGNEPASP